MKPGSVPTTPEAPANNPAAQQQELCYFTFVPPSPSIRCSLDSPFGSSLLSPAAPPSPDHPLLALRSDGTMDSTGSSTPSSPSSASSASSPASSATTASATDLDSQASKLLQLQTSAAYAAPVSPMPRRPQPTPLQGWQDVLDLDGNADEGPLNSPSLDGLRTLSFERRVRCSRCHRKSTQGQSPLTRSNMISFGTNLYYCARCANMVGYPPR